MEIQLTKAQEEMLYQANVRLTTLYMLPDICEALLQDILDYRKKAGVHGFKFEQKKYWNAFKKDSYNLRKVMKTAPENVRESYADMCELIQDAILLMIDRCGEGDIQLLFRFIDYLRSFPSKRHIEFDFDK